MLTMVYFHPTILCCFVFAFVSHGYSESLVDSPCGDWTPYQNEKCIKLVDRAGFQTKEDAEVICKTFAEELHGVDVPNLVTVKTQEKQQFLQKLLFEDLATFDNVWLGLELGKDDSFHWNDGTDLFFTNWIEESGNDAERRCVQLESGEGANERGKWVRVNCKKRNAVVCERTQPWTLATLHDNFLSLKLEVGRIKQEADQEIESLKKNVVPIGFTYVQLPGQDPPTTLWPQTSWKDVGSDYAGLFFRVEGGDAAPFGDVQGDNTRRLAYLHSVWSSENVNPVYLRDDGSWSHYIWTGKNGVSDQTGLRVKFTTGEIRPRNKSVKVWQRIK